MTNEQDNQYLQYLMNAARDIDLSYWNALITANSAIIAIFSIMATITNSKSPILLIIIILSIFSIILPLYNFTISRSLYKKNLMIILVKKCQ